MKYLIAFGCSFTYGDELIDPALEGKVDFCDSQNDAYRNSHNYPGILAKYYGLELINTGFPGGSLESERYALDWLIHKKRINLAECMIVAGHTQAHRTSWYDRKIDKGGFNAQTHSAWHKTPDLDQKWFDLTQLWYKKSYDWAWEEYNLRQTVRLFNSVKWEQGIPVIQFKAFDNEPTVADLPDFTFQSIAGKNLKPHGHPDEKGHQLFANHLINYIDRVILHEC
jgi:hypothetical protein